MVGSRDSIKLGAKLLLEGAKMLNTPCPICRNPIYQLRDKRLYCATCQKEVIKENDPKIMENHLSSTQSTEGDPIEIKIKQLSVLLNAETNPDEILKIANTIKKLQKIQQNQS